MNKREQAEFVSYLKNCTDKQVYRIIQQERNAQRNDFAALAKAELKRRGLEL